jgi:hypothetical protein
MGFSAIETTPDQACHRQKQTRLASVRVGEMLEAA